MTTTFPPTPPRVTGVQVSVDAYLTDTPRVTRAVSLLAAQRFIIDKIFRPGPTATSGAVLFDQVAVNELYTARDVQPIQPGAEFPLVTTTEPAPLVARTVKWGGAGDMTYEEIRRDRRDVLARVQTRITNTIIRKVDSVAVGVLRAAPINVAMASAAWANQSATIVRDIAAVKVLVDRLDMGYEINTILINPQTKVDMISNNQLLTQLPREGMAGDPNPIEIGELRGVMGLTWYATNRVNVGEAFFLDSNMAGNYSDELPMYSRVVDMPEIESKKLMAARLVACYVTDPLSVVRLVGI